jgi:hypothetical protein
MTLCGGSTLLPHTTLEPRDEPAFLAVMDRIIGALTVRERPGDVYLVDIDNWFDCKWLRYSGSGAVAFPEGDGMDNLCDHNLVLRCRCLPPVAPKRKTITDGFSQAFRPH